jgi:hypothetical protein
MAFGKLFNTASQRDEPDVLIDVPAPQASTATAIVVAENNIQLTPEWPDAIRMVERAAGLIKDYEQKLRDIEDETRAYAAKVADEQDRARQQIRQLEDIISHLETVNAQTSDELSESRIQIIAGDIRERELHARLASAEDEILQGDVYMRRVGELLADI